MKRDKKSSLKILEHFPVPVLDSNESEDIAANPAIKLYGNKFYNNQTSLECLSEFLLVFASEKGVMGENKFSFSLKNGTKSVYWVEDRLPLRFFCFFTISKLETRHPIHQQAYLSAIGAISDVINVPSLEEKQRIIKLLQNLLIGFSDHASNRTWVGHIMLPASTRFLYKEINWSHSTATKGKWVDKIQDWKGSKKFFTHKTRNMFGRGGEMLFLQLSNLFSSRIIPADSDLENMLNMECYKHISKKKFSGLKNSSYLKEEIEKGLKHILQETLGVVNDLVDFIEFNLKDYELSPENKELKLGWVPMASRCEAILFAVEMDNICSSGLGGLEKLELLEILCVMQILRSLCFQAVRFEDENSIFSVNGFAGGYVWLVCSPRESSKSALRKISINSFSKIAEILFRVVRSPVLGKDEVVADTKELKNADAGCLGYFRKLAKQIGFVVPRAGSGERFVLPPHLLRFLVAALLRPGERVRLTEFYARVFAHYGIALGERQLATALAWTNSYHTDKDYAISADTTCIEEALRQGGFLMELSDAVSIVHNPRCAEY